MEITEACETQLLARLTFLEAEESHRLCMPYQFIVEDILPSIITRFPNHINSENIMECEVILTETVKRYLQRLKVYNSLDWGRDNDIPEQKRSELPGYIPWKK